MNISQAYQQNRKYDDILLIDYDLGHENSDLIVFFDMEDRYSDMEPTKGGKAWAKIYKIYKVLHKRNEISEFKNKPSIDMNVRFNDNKPVEDITKEFDNKEMEMIESDVTDIIINERQSNY